MKLTLTIALLIVILSIINIAAQVDTVWVKRFNGPANLNDVPKVITVDKNGFIYVGGQISVNNENPEFGVIKYNSLGDTVWTGYYLSPVQLGGQVNDMVLDNSGNVIATGMCVGSSYTADFLIVKFDVNGNQLWARIIDGGYSDVANAVTADNIGNIYATGSSEAFYESSNYITIKFNPDGDTVWARTFDGITQSGDYATAISLDGQGNVYVAGTSECYLCGESDYLTIKYDPSGHMLWQQRYNDPADNNDYVRGLVLDNNANVYVAGISFNSDNNLDYLIHKYSTNGDSLWIKRYNNPINTDDWLAAVALDSSGNVIVTGKSYIVGTGYDYLTIKYSPDGTEEWIKNYAGYSDHIDGAAAIVTDKYDNIYITGSSSASSTNIDYATIKYDKYGNQIWAATYNGTGNSSDDAVSIDADNSGNIYITGISIGLGTGADFATIKYVQSSSGAVEEQMMLSPEFKLYQNYPNPFNPSTNLPFVIGHSAFVTLKVYDVLGNEVAKLVNGHKPAGKYEINFNAPSLPSGVYFYRINAGNYTAVKKMLLLK